MTAVDRTASLKPRMMQMSKQRILYGYFKKSIQTKCKMLLDLWKVQESSCLM